MRRINPWVLWPVLAAVVGGGLIGWIVTTVGCQPDPCPGAAAVVAALAALVSGVGVAVVVVLAVRSLAEWREAAGSGRPPPTPGCETGDEQP